MEAPLDLEAHCYIQYPFNKHSFFNRQPFLDTGPGLSRYVLSSCLSLVYSISTLVLDPVATPVTVHSIRTNYDPSLPQNRKVKTTSNDNKVWTKLEREHVESRILPDDFASF